MKTILLTAFAAVTMLATQAQSTWKVDAVHSNVRFNVSHLVVSEVEGSFKKFEGNCVNPNAGDDFSKATIDFSIDVATINTDNEMRDNHLKGDDFFNAEKFPQMKFKSKSMTKTGDKTYKLVGDMTIRDVTKPIELTVTYGGTVKDPYGNTKAGFKVQGTINRIAYGLKWNQLTEAGGSIVGEEVSFRANLEMTKQK
jgi:hypothetical protein